MIPARWRLAPDGLPRQDAPFGRGPLAARVLARVISGAVWAGSRTPPSVSHRLAVVGGTVEWAVRPRKRTALAANIAHAVGGEPDAREVRRLVRREVVNEAHRSADLLWALGRPADFLAAVTLDGIEHAQRAAEAGTGVVLMGVHIGGWELATVIPDAVLPVPATAIVADDWLAWAIQHMRQSVGLRIAYRTAPMSRLGRRLRSGEALIVLGDHASGFQPRMHRVRFADAEAELPAGGVTLARLYGASIVTFVVVREGPRRWRAIIDRPLDPPPRRSGEAGDREVLQVLADRWTEWIRRYPDQWAANYHIPWHPPAR